MRLDRLSWNGSNKDSSAHAKHHAKVFCLPLRDEALMQPASTAHPPAARPITPRTAAVVPCSIRSDLLPGLLASLRSQSLPFARVIVVDNGSGGAVAAAAATCSDTELVTLPRNRGFARGCNAGIRHALADDTIDCIALLNDDVLLAPDWHREAARALLADPRHGACATVLARQAEPDRIDSAGIAWARPGWADNHLAGQPLAAAGDETRELPGACAGAALYRRALFEGIGLFDEHLFAYHEDVDLALRAARAGWRCVLAPAARGRHFGHGSNRPFPLGGSWADYFNARNRPYVLVKALPAADWRQHWRALIGAYLCSLMRSVRERRAAAVLAGALHALLRLPRALHARHRLSARHRSPR
jgi:GT2 family glycosyltransferase